jgi:Dephospho-CoA kinase
MGLKMKTLKTRTENKTVDRTGIIIVGYPGAGKTTVAELFYEYTESMMIETGDVVRHGATEYYDRGLDDISSHELGEYSTMRREEDGGDYVALDIIDALKSSDEFPDIPAIVCGMRDEEAYGTFTDFFDTMNIISVTANREKRLHRLQSRGENDESEFTMSDLLERDNREDGWGTHFWMNSGLSEDHVHRYEIENENTVDALRSSVKTLIPIIGLPVHERH